VNTKHEILALMEDYPFISIGQIREAIGCEPNDFSLVDEGLVRYEEDSGSFSLMDRKQRIVERVREFPGSPLPLIQAAAGYLDREHDAFTADMEALEESGHIRWLDGDLFPLCPACGQVEP